MTIPLSMHCLKLYAKFECSINVIICFMWQSLTQSQTPLYCTKIRGSDSTWKLLNHYRCSQWTNTSYQTMSSFWESTLLKFNLLWDHFQLVKFSIFWVKFWCILLASLDVYDCSFGLEVHGGSNWATDYTTISYRMLFLKEEQILIPKNLKDPKWTVFYGFFGSNDTLDFFRRRLIYVKIDEFHLASNVPTFNGFGLNFILVECFKGIQWPKFHRIWPELHDTLEHVLDRKITLICSWKAMKICKDLVDFMFQISTFGIGNQSFWSCLKNVM